MSSLERWHRTQCEMIGLPHPTSRRDKEQRLTDYFPVPKGRRAVATGFSPWKLNPIGLCPRGAAESESVHRIPVAPSERLFSDEEPRAEARGYKPAPLRGENQLGLQNGIVRRHRIEPSDASIGKRRIQKDARPDFPLHSGERSSTGLCSVHGEVA